MVNVLRRKRSEEYGYDDCDNYVEHFEGDNDGDADGDDEDDDEDHLEGDICVRHGRLRIKVFEQQLDVRTAFSPVPRPRALHSIINRDFFVIVLYSLNKILVNQKIPENFRKRRLWQHRPFN